VAIYGPNQNVPSAMDPHGDHPPKMNSEPVTELMSALKLALDQASSEAHFEFAAKIGLLECVWIWILVTAYLQFVL